MWPRDGPTSWDAVSAEDNLGVRIRGEPLAHRPKCLDLGWRRLPGGVHREVPSTITSASIKIFSPCQGGQSRLYHCIGAHQNVGGGSPFLKKYQRFLVAYDDDLSRFHQS